MKRIRHIILIILAGIILFSATAAIYSLSRLTELINTKEEIFITIPRNTSLDRTIDIINGKGALQPKWFFKISVKIYAKLFNAKVYAGSYRFKPENTNLDALYAVFTGKQLYTIKVTFPEGIRLEKFASIAAAKLDIDSTKFMRIVNSDSLRAAHNIPARTSEGYLMPNTYEFYWKEDVGEIINKLIEAQNRIWQEKFAQQAASSGMTRHEILTLASIIEAETPADDEKPRISGVYHNRIRRGMLLQADPTIQYILGGKKRLLYRDLNIDSPYNTYKYAGLPPAPINSPGAKSIDAAIEPEQNDYLYFVAIGDGSRRHNFARTPLMHTRNVYQFRQNRKNNH